MDNGGFRTGRGQEDWQVYLTRVGPQNARTAAERVLISPRDLVVSTGFAGGLKPGLRVGELVLDSDRSDPSWLQRAERAAQKGGLACHRGKFLCVEAPLKTAADKERAFRASGAIAVEMESAPILELCCARGIPFLGVRALSDTAEQDLPRHLRVLRSDGTIRWSYFARLALCPADWAPFARLVRGSRAAGGSLAILMKELTRS